MDIETLNALKIDSDAFLQNESHRQRCPKCKSSRMYYCYICNEVVGCNDDASLVPKVKTLLLYPDPERAQPLASYFTVTADDVDQAPTIIDRIVVIDATWNQAGGIVGDDRLAIITFWFDDSSFDDGRNFILLHHYHHKREIILFTKAQYLMLIQPDLDCVIWKASAVVKDTTIRLDLENRVVLWTFRSVLPRASLSNNQKSYFWRYNSKSDNKRYVQGDDSVGDINSVSTIEAIYYASIEVWLAQDHRVTNGNLSSVTDSDDVAPGHHYDGRYDNLLFYFRFLFDKLYAWHSSGQKRVLAFDKRLKQSSN